MSLCFTGYIVRAWADFSDQSRPMHFECQVTYQDAIDNAPSTSVKGPVNAVDLFSKLASSLGYSFQNNGVTGVVNNPILTGSYIDQLKTLSKQTSSNCLVDLGIVKTAPIGFALINAILNINSKSGLLSYPTIDDLGVKFKIRYDPVLQIGQYIHLDTIVPIPKATGQWYVYDMQSTLNDRHEYWYTDLKCSFNSLIAPGGG
jgi:hypothetical protein